MWCIFLFTVPFPFSRSARLSVRLLSKKAISDVNLQLVLVLATLSFKNRRLTDKRLSIQSFCDKKCNLLKPSNLSFGWGFITFQLNLGWGTWRVPFSSLYLHCDLALTETFSSSTFYILSVFIIIFCYCQLKEWRQTAELFWMKEDSVTLRYSGSLLYLEACIMHTKHSTRSPWVMVLQSLL